MALAQAARPIPGAVATVGVSDRVAFLRRTYGLLGVALIAFALFTTGMMQYAAETSLRWSMWAWTGRYNYLMVMMLFMGVSYIATRLAVSQTSRGLQLVGLGVYVVAQSFLLQPLLWYCFQRFGNHDAGNMIGQAALVTVAIFVGLTATVFITKKDFSFLRGILSICAFAMIGMIIASLAFGFTLGIVFIAFGIAVLSGYILYQTSIVMSQFPPSAYVAAALMLFGTVATLFYYVLSLFASMRNRN